ncbi:nitroreductase [Paramyrothecium foliicola]|nr:nitroreductase [Paramyrothecium foliicola]
MGSALDNTQLDLLRERYGDPLDGNMKTSPWTPTVSQLLSHISVRRYLKDEPLPNGTLEILMAAAQSASTGSMLQSWSVVAITDPERKAHVATLAGDQDWIRQAPLFLIFCIDLRRLAESSESQGRPGDGAGLKRIDLFIMATIDAAMAAQNAAVAAESLGLGMCYAGAARNNARELADYLNLPNRVIGIFGMAVGHADPAFLNSRKPRLPIAEVMHRNVWNDENHEHHIAEYEATLGSHYKRQNKHGRPSWTAQVANFVA